jgi:hypothetical protein
MRLTATLLAVTLLAPLPALAQDDMACRERIDQFEGRLPELGAQADQQAGVSEEHLEGAAAALDAARLADETGEEDTCRTLVQAARAMLDRGGFQPE